MRGRFSPAAVGAFEFFFRPWMRRRLHAIHTTGVPHDLPPDHPLLLVSNHVSWWDGFLLRELQRSLRPRALAPAVVLPVGIHLEPLNTPSPSVYVSAGESMSITDAGIDREMLELRVESELDDIHRFLITYGEEADEHWT